MKKAATAYKRAATNKTGFIDPLKLNMEELIPLPVLLRLETGYVRLINSRI